MVFLKKYRLVIFVSLFLFLIPFFWLRPGEMDLGGDASRLYFYDPINYLKHYSLYDVVPFGIGLTEPHFYNLPFLGLLIIIKQVIGFPYLLISIFNSLKLVIGFLAIYGIVKELIENKAQDTDTFLFREVAAIFAGIFYVFSPNTTANFTKALLYHNQIFLNPLVFYLLLKYVTTFNIRYLWVTLITSFLFAPNFAWVSAPPFFAFYPLSIIFLLLYVVFIRQKNLPWKGILIGFLVFLGLQAFHLIPEIVNLLDPGTYLNTRVFSKEDILHQLDYFFGVLPLAKVSLNILLPSPMKEFNWASILLPSIVILGFLLNSKRNKALLLTGVFFLITLFLLSAKITNVGVELYKRLFYIPGFTMFRNFIGQWLFVFSFFYALLFGQALFLVSSRLKKTYIKILYFAIGIILTVGAWPLINGEIVNRVHFQSNNVRTTMVMDPKYEKTLEFIRSLPDDGKILTLPFTDCCYQVVHGTNNGAYVGVSTIAFLTGKKDFNGYAIIAPFSETFLRLAKAKDYESIKRMLGLLNIRYVFYNSDPKIYDTTFFGYPYQYVRQYFPNEQNGYFEFVKNLTGKKIFESGSYSIYLVDQENFLPHFYTSFKVVFYDDDTRYNMYDKASAFFPNINVDERRAIYLERQTCKNIFLEKLCGQQITDNQIRPPKIQFEKINPTKYRVKIFDAQNPYFLIFSEAFNKNWKVFITPTNSLRENKTLSTYFNGDVEEGIHKNIFLDSNTFETINMRSFPESRHLVINSYANAWYITPEDIGGRENYELIVEMTEQRIFYICLAISLVTFIGCLFWGIRLFCKRKKY